MKNEKDDYGKKFLDKFNVLNKEDLDISSPSSESSWLAFWAKPAPEGFWALFAAHFDEWFFDQNSPLGGRTAPTKTIHGTGGRFPGRGQREVLVGRKK